MVFIHRVPALFCKVVEFNRQQAEVFHAMGEMLRFVPVAKFTGEAVRARSHVLRSPKSDLALLFREHLRAFQMHCITSSPPTLIP